MRIASAKSWAKRCRYTHVCKPPPPPPPLKSGADVLHYGRGSQCVFFSLQESGQITNTPLSLDTTKHSKYITLHHAVHGKMKTQAQIHNGEYIYSVRHIIGKAAEALKVIPKSAGVDPCDGLARVDPPLPAGVRHVSGLSDYSAEVAGDGIHPAFFSLLTKVCGAYVCFTQESRVAHFDIDSWVAVHEYYVLDLFPPPGTWFTPFSDVWVCSDFPTVPQELQGLQEQVLRWGPGTIGTDCRTNVFFLACQECFR